MPRCPGRSLLLVALVLTASACSDSGATSSESPATPTSPTVPVSEPLFTGTLTTNGAKADDFFLTTSGTISVRVTSLVPDNPVGLWIGAWAQGQCTFGVGVDDATATDSSPNDPTTVYLNAYAISAGFYCVRIYDSLSNVPTGGATFGIEVRHP